ncbi:MAG: HAD family hydrolase [Flavobacteriia bacterium]|nr:HAD family hydrolase [Flavobacteriia bacterium]
MIKNIFFDFDGVLAESVNVKTEAFKNLYLPFGEEIANKVVEHHLAHGGISRFEKIKKYHQDFLGIELSENEVFHWAEKFSELVLIGVIESPEVKGAEDFLKKNFENYQFWVITGTPTEEIKIILEKRNWNSYFKGAFGSPEKKNHWTEFLIEKYDINRKETVFVGDATTDQEAAYYSKLHFILRRNEDNKHLFKNYKGFELNDLTNLNEILKSI